MVFLQNRQINDYFTLAPSSINHIPISCKSYQPQQAKVRVHAVDKDRGQLFFSWLIILDT